MLLTNVSTRIFVIKTLDLNLAYAVCEVGRQKLFASDFKKLNKKNMDEVSRKYVQASEIDGVKKSLVIVLDRELDISQFSITLVHTKL